MNLEKSSPYWKDCVRNALTPIALKGNSQSFFSIQVEKCLSFISSNKYEDATNQISIEIDDNELSEIEISYIYHLKAYINILQEKWLSCFNNLEKAIHHNSELYIANAGLAVLYAIEQEHEKSLTNAKIALEHKVEIANGLVSLSYWQSCVELGLPLDDKCAFISVDENEDIDKILEYFPKINDAYISENYDKSDYVIYISSDCRYFFDYTIPQILSIFATESKASIHIHVVNPDEKVKAILEKLAGSYIHGIKYTNEFLEVENICPPSIYYSCVRFIRLYQSILKDKRTHIITDADMLYNKSSDLLFNALDNKNIGLCYFPYEPIWQRYAAGCLMINVGQDSIDFLEKISNYIGTHLFYKKGRWFLDQAAIYNAVKVEKINYHLIDVDVCGLQCEDKQIIWAVTNEKNDITNVFNRRKNELLSLAKEKLGDIIQNNNKTINMQENNDDILFNDLTKSRYGYMLYNKYDQYIGKAIRGGGSWCQHELDLMSQIIKPGDTVVEVGANIGSHTLALCKMVGINGKVYAFEAQRIVFQMLAGNMALNSITNAYCYHKAIGQTKGFIDIPIIDYKTFNNFGGVSLINHESNKGESVEIINLDLLNLQSCHLIKLDIEGMETEALLGASVLIQTFRPFLYVEYNKGNNQARLLNTIKNFNYHVFMHGTENDPMIFCVPRDRGITVNGLREL